MTMRLFVYVSLCLLPLAALSCGEPECHYDEERCVSNNVYTCFADEGYSEWERDESCTSSGSTCVEFSKTSARCIFTSLECTERRARQCANDRYVGSCVETPDGLKVAPWDWCGDGERCVLDTDGDARCEDEK